MNKLAAVAVSGALLACGVFYVVAANAGSASGSAIPSGITAIVNRSAPADDLYASQFCTGTLVSPWVVLTAAHCVSHQTPERLDVVVDADNLCRPDAIAGERIHVSRFAQPPPNSQWSPDAVALILASQSSERPVSVAPVPPNGDVDAYGWSSKRVMGTRQCHLRRIPLAQLPNATCKSAITDPRRWSPSRTEMLCAVPARAETANTCHGDSGGPVFARGSLVAMTVSGVGCGLYDPGAYLRVGALSAWLRTLDASPPRLSDTGKAPAPRNPPDLALSTGGSTNSGPSRSPGAWPDRASAGISVTRSPARRGTTTGGTHSTPSRAT